MQVDPLELEYKWGDAAKSYERRVTSETETEEIQANSWQRIGYCYSLASRQAEKVEEFKRLRQLAVKAYKTAAQLHRHETSEEAKGNGFYCVATAEYNRSWLASNSIDKRESLENCYKLGKEALEAFKKASDKYKYAEVCNMLSICVCDLNGIITTTEEKRRLLQEGLNYASKAMNLFSKLDKIDELVVSLAVSSIAITYLYEISDHWKWKSLSNKSLKLAHEAVKLSQKTQNPYSKLMSSWAAGASTIEFEEDVKKRGSLDYLKEMLLQSRLIRDNYLEGIAYRFLAYTTYANLRWEGDPEKRKQKIKDMLQFSINGIKKLQIVCQYAEIANCYLYFSESYSDLAREFTINPSEKRATLKKGIKIGEKGLEYAIRSGAPWGLWVNLHALSRAFQYYSSLEPGKEKKVKLLEMALGFRKEEIEKAKKTFGSNVWFIGTAMVYAAQIEAELAKLEKDKEKKAYLFQNALKDMEKGVSECKKQLDFFIVPPVTSGIAVYDDILGEMQIASYSLTKKRENLIKSNETYDDAARYFKKLGLPSRAAESYWKIARNYDLLGEYGKASDNFQRAFSEYNIASEKIPQFKNFYLDYSIYMEGWMNIEKAKLAHSFDEFSKAEQYYRRTSVLFQRTKSWSYLSSNFNAWSLLERSEDLSRNDNGQEAIFDFEKAIESFRYSKRLLIDNSPEIKHTDEKDLINRLVKISDSREKYSQGRIAIEEAKILDKEGDHAASSGKYRTASILFKNLIQAKSEQIGTEAKPLYYLCLAWEKMTMAEAKVSSEMYGEAAELFKMANEHTQNESTNLLTLAHSSFCKALEAGTKFETNRNIAMYTEANKHMNIAASYYLKAGFENFSDYATATQRLFESYVFMDQARRETDPEKQAKYYLMAEKVLQMSADCFAKAKYNEKAKQVQRLLRKVKEDKELAISLNEVFHAPVVTSSTASFSTLSLSEEKAVGLERLAQMDVLAKLIVQKSDATVGQNKTLNIQIVNIGKVPVWLTKIEDMAPMGSQLISGPNYACVENRNLTIRGKQLSPMKMEEIEIVLRPIKKGTLVIKPRITYVDETGRQSFNYPESMSLNVSEMILPDRVATGNSELDNLLLGGIPERYSVLLMSRSSDERQLLVNEFVETGAKENQPTFYVTTNANCVKSLAEAYPSNFYLFLCNPRADAVIKDFVNVFKLNGVENLTNIDIAIAKGLNTIDASSDSVKRACIEIVSDVLLLHQAPITQKWLSQLLAELRAKGFTTLAVLNPQMHSQEEVQAILEHFEGEIQICEKEIEKGPVQFLRVRKLINKKYLDAELLLTKES